MELKFIKATDSEHKIKLESSLIYAAWRAGVGYAGQAASFEVVTAFVGDGASIKIKGSSENGVSLGKISDKIKNNIYIGQLEIPENIKIGDTIYFEAELPDNGVSGESNRITVLPPVEITNMKWSAKEARRGDTLTLSADVKGIRNGTEVGIVIYEYDRDGIHDRIAELPAVVQNQKIEVNWEYEYHEDADEIPTAQELQKYGRNYNPPEYFFTVKIGELEYGRNQESGLLEFKDWVEIVLKSTGGKPIGDEDYILYLPDGSQRKGKLDASGYAKEENIPPGRIRIEMPNLSRIRRQQG